MKTRYHFSRQRAQLRHLGKQLLLLQQKGEAIPSDLLAKFRSLCKKLLPRFGAVGLKRTLGAAVFLLGFGLNTQAQSFQPPAIDTFGFNSAVLVEAYYNHPAFADLDNDGDLDLMTAFSTYDDSTELYTTHFYYYENVGTPEAADFADPQLNPFGIPVFMSDINPIDLVDVDGDGDLDIVTTGFNYDAGAEGTGASFLIPNEGDAANPAFGEMVINGLNLPTPGVLENPLFFATGDLDNDGDLDVLGNAYDENGNEGFINYYYENTSTEGGIEPAAPQINPFGISNGSTVGNLIVFSDLADLDNDGDLDLLAGQASYMYGSGVYDFNVLFYENSGTPTEPTFGTAVENPFGITLLDEDIDQFPRPTTVDIDNDGDLDLFTFFNGKLFFQENTLISSTTEQLAQLELTLSPNPTTGIVQLATTEKVARIEVSNLMGQQVYATSSTATSLDISEQPAGIYLVKITTEDNRFQVFRIKKQ